MFSLLLTLFVMVKGKKYKNTSGFIGCADLVNKKVELGGKNTNKKIPTTNCEQIKISKTIIQIAPVQRTSLKCEQD